MGFPGGWDDEESTCSAGDLGSTPGSGISPGEGNGFPLQYSFLENFMDRGAWWAASLWSQRVRHGWRTNTHTHRPLRVPWAIARLSSVIYFMHSISSVCICQHQSLSSSHPTSLSPGHNSWPCSICIISGKTNKKSENEMNRRIRDCGICQEGRKEGGEIGMNWERRLL